jgi:hypothetical protein
VPAQPQGPPGQQSQQSQQSQQGQAASGQPAPALVNYTAMEARNFADGRHSILDIRNAVAAEFGPVALDDVTRFFRDLEAAGTYVIAERK